MVLRDASASKKTQPEVGQSLSNINRTLKYQKPMQIRTTDNGEQNLGGCYQTDSNKVFWPLLYFYLE